MKADVENETQETPAGPRKNEKRGGNVVLAFLLIFIGFLFLANNLGVLSWTLWAELWRFWPVLLILLGIQFLLGRSTIAQIIMAVTAVSVFAFIFFYVLAGAGALKGTGLEKWGPPMRSDEIVQQEHRVATNDYQNIKDRKFSIDVGVGKFDLRDDAIDDYFFLTTSMPNNDKKPFVQSRKDTDTLAITVDVPGRNMGPAMNPFSDRYVYTGQIGQPKIPASIDLDIGAGEGIIEFDSLVLRDMSIHVGVGSSTVLLKEQSIPEAVDLDVGVGSITFSVPENVGVELDYNVGLGSLSMDGQGLKGNGTYRTKNFDQASKKVKVSAHVGTGSIAIQQK